MTLPADLTALRAEIGEPGWRVLVEGHEEHMQSYVALLDGEGVCLIQLGKYGKNETRERHRERAQALANLLNGEDQ